ncbi:berberine bridge enzyme-like 23 [Diospyros lotus]|uniref:berberine bridge enzyme-like 23 n=1 Tax=Diospyros lotus TaxID=55363 RepID=UPI00224E4F94|nr:berberine bridge enzyme-like 23 [Diospyros lotus]
MAVADHSTVSRNKTSEYIFSPASTAYYPLLQSSQQNPRWINSTLSKPLFIITPYAESQIQAAVVCARNHGLQVRARSGGHDYEGLSYLCTTRFVLVDLLNLRSVALDPEKGTAWVQSGATLGELYYSIAKNTARTYGFPAGLCPSVGIGGHFSGGGFGTMLRKYGLAADNVVDARFVNVYGRILDREAMGEDVFWAIRGGGGASFGIILSWKIKLVRVPSLVTVFTIDKRLEEGATGLVLRWQNVAHKLPEDLFIRVIIQDDGGESLASQKTVKTSFNSLFLGRKDELIPIMNKRFPELGLQAKECTEMSWIESVLYFAGYPRGQPLEVLLSRTTLYKTYFKAKSDFVKEPIPETGLQGIWERILEEKLVFMIMDPYGGKMDEISESELPFPHRKGNLYNIQYLVKWEENGFKATKKHVNWIRMLYQYMEPFVSNSPRGAYLNYRDLDLGINRRGRGGGNYSEAQAWGRKYFKGNLERLAMAKAMVDPENFFRNEQSIPVLPTGRKNVI